MGVGKGLAPARCMRAYASPFPTPDTRRLGEFFAGAKNSHGASEVTGPSPKPWRLEVGPSDAAGMDEYGQTFCGRHE